MTLLFNYLYKYILEYIINYIIYISNIIPNSYYINNEVIKYSTVCKYYYQLVSEILKRNLNQDTYNTLKYFIQDSPSSNIEQQHQQQPFKLIKIKDSIICYSMWENDQSLLLKALENCKYYKQVYIHIGNNEIVEQLFKLDQLPNNLQLQIFFKSYYEERYKQYLNQIDKIYSDDQDSDILYSIVQIPSNFVYDLLDLFSQRYLFYLEFKFISSSSQRIKMDDLFIPNETLTNSSTDNQSHSTERLDQFILKTTINDILKVVPINSIQDNDSIKWQYVINKISNDSTLKSMEYNIRSYNEHCIGKLTQLEINSGFKSILTNQRSIETLSISSRIELDDLIIEGLELNKSIKTLRITKYRYGFTELLKRILLGQHKHYNNITIRNLYINDSGYNSSVKWLSILQQHKDQIHLHSVSVVVANSEFNQYLDYIKSNQFNVNEFIIINCNSIGLNSKVHHHYHHNNNTILNIIE